MPITMPAAQLALWSRMVAEDHPWIALIRSKAVQDNTSQMRYASGGRWSGLYYLISGDPAFGRRCYATVSAATNAFQTPMKPGNETREHTIERVLMLDWIRPTLSAEEIALYTDWLTRTAEGCIGATLRIVDSDQVSGTWGFFALLDTVCGTTFLTREVANGRGGKLIPMGGLDAPAADRTTYRNAVRQYIETIGAGGQWIESQEYNLGTPNLLYMAWVGLHTALGTDHLPEFAAWLPASRIYHRHELIPGGRFAFQWSDVQDAHGMHWVNRDTTYAFLRSGDAPCEQFAADVDGANARVVPSASLPAYPRYFYYADPYAARAEWRSTPLLHVTPGTGHAYWRTGWDKADRATHLTGPVFSSATFVDHWPNQFGTFQHARDGRFLLDQPQGYSAWITCGNVLLVCASGPSREAGALTASAYVEQAIAYGACTNCGMGPEITGTYYQPPPTYLHEYTRAVFELLDGPESVIIIADRVHTDDPRTQLLSNGKPALTRYPAASQTRMTAARGLVDLLWHTPVAPTPTVDYAGFSWLVPNTSWRVEIRQVLPHQPFTATVVNEAAQVMTAELPEDRADDAITPLVAESEKKWRVHTTAPEPATLPTFQVIVHVLIASEGAHDVTTEPLETDLVRGVLVTRPDHPDVAVLVSAQPGPVVTYNQADLGIVTTARLLTTSFRVPLPRLATVYLADLDPAVSWQATCDGTRSRLAWVGDLVRVDSDHGGELKLWANEEPPLPVRPIIPDWRITEQTATRIVLER